MNLIIPDEDIDITDPTLTEIEQAVRRSFIPTGNATVLTVSEEDNLFIQNIADHIEHCAGPDGPIYSADGVPVDLAVQMYLAYATGQDTWRTAVDWQMEIEDLRTYQSSGSSIARHPYSSTDDSEDQEPAPLSSLSVAVDAQLQNKVSPITLTIGGHEFSFPQNTARLLYFSDATPDVSTIGLSVTVHFQNGQREETVNTQGPSVIFSGLPITKPEDISTVPRLNDWPSYAQCSPEQRWKYLDWLKNPSDPIEIGNVCIYYYGLEQQMLYGMFDLAVDEVIWLRQHHQHPSFIGYSASALLRACQTMHRLDRLPEMLPSFSRKDFAKTDLLILYLTGRDIQPPALMKLGNWIPGVNTRYIRLHPEKYQAVLETLLISKYNRPALPISTPGLTLDALPQEKTIAFANTSLPRNVRNISIPDFLAYPPFLEESTDVLSRTHDLVKESLGRSPNRQ